MTRTWKALRRPDLLAGLVVSALLLTAAGGCRATPGTQPTLQPITREMLTGRPPNFSGSYARGMRWLDGEHYLHAQHGELKRVEALSGSDEAAYDVAALAAALEAQGGFEESDARRCAERPLAWTDDRSGVLIQHERRLYFCRLADGQVVRLTEEARPRRTVALAPDGSSISFVLDNDLYAIDTTDAKEVRLTQDGSDTLLNGILDWVYQEEIYGRGAWGAHWWRDDGRYLAYIQLDESAVPLYAIVDYIPHLSDIERTRYPKAGDPLPVARLGVADPRTGQTVWIDLPRPDDTDLLITRVGWTPTGQLIFTVQDREQRWLDLNEADPQTGRSRTLIHETSPAWVDRLPLPEWLPDGSFLWLSARHGYQHVYHYTADGRLIARVTDGPWPVRNVIGYDEATDYVYFTGSRETVLETHAYRVPLGGGEIEQLTEPGYSHNVNFDPTLHLFFDTFSNVATPPQVVLRNADGTPVRVISENHVETLEKYSWPAGELLQVVNRNGRPLNVKIIRPADFDPSRRYPVLMPVYGGPDAPTVRNRWGGYHELFERYLATQGYMICYCDPYSATGGVAIAAWHAYRRLGEVELADYEDVVRYLVEHESADPERIGMTGYSYGGYIVAYALTHSTMFKMGIAGGLLSDWRNYDAVYVERYMQTPDHNPAGYDNAAVSNAAHKLHGHLLIVHGLMDDNVHFQNTAQLINALQEQVQRFDLMVYPRDGHGIGHGHAHFRELQLRYITENL
ncbi:MAG: S9 family peptidase [Phycisphaerae bacterium]|jgi:dipeptidyl-peptidase-4